VLFSIDFMRRVLRLIPAVLAAFFLLSCSTNTVGTYFAPTVAVVNGEKIPESKMSERIRLAMREPDFAKMMRRGGLEGRRDRLSAQREVLTRLIQDEVLLQSAAKLGVNIGRRQIDSQLSQIRAQFASAEGFDNELKRLGITELQAREIISSQLLVQGVQEALTRDVSAPAEQLRQFYDQNKAEFDAQIQIAHILVCGNTNPTTRLCDATPQDEASAKSLAQRAKQGENFSDLAGQHSQDKSTSGQGGDLGWATRSPNPTPFEDTAFGLGVGQVSDPVQSAQGWHIIKVLKKGRSFEDASEEIEAQVLSERKTSIYQEWLSKALRDSSKKVRVNRRYGRFDTNSLRVVPVDSPANA
jgi:parvulin-like peptidyl-prolyl isomerase